MRPKSSLAVLAVVLIVAGVAMMLENFGLIHGAWKLWPVMVLFLGMGFVLLFYERGRVDLFLMWMGTCLILCSVFFFFLNFSTWRSMSRLWPLFLGIAGGSFLSVYALTRTAVFGFIALGLMSLGLIFYLVFGVSIAFWPISLIVFGISLLIVNFYNMRRFD